jgi:hypothetical protein
VAATTDDGEVLSALRLGWSIAEARGRDRPGGPHGADAEMPDHADHALPLRIERSRTELRIQVQASIASLAKELTADTRRDGSSYSTVLNRQAKLLWQRRAPTAYQALEGALETLDTLTAPEATTAGPDAPTVDKVLWLLKDAVVKQQRVVATRPAIDDQAQAKLDAAREQLEAATGQGEAALATAKAAEQTAVVEVQLEAEQTVAEANGLERLQEAAAALERAIAQDRKTAAQSGRDAVQMALTAIWTDTSAVWNDLANLIWQFDAHIQDQLAASSEVAAAAYQLGRGLAETYWALDPDRQDGSTSWGFLLGTARCDELTRLLGRLASYANPYTAPAVASSLDIWHDVATTAGWRGPVADRALYLQIRRWYELLILGQDPTTLIKPYAVMRNWRTIRKAIRLFWPQVAATVIGLGFVVTLIVLFSLGAGSAWQKTLSAILGALGLTVASLTGFLKNSAQALIKRLRQDTYTDLIATAIQTAPPAPKRGTVQASIARRELTPVTPN